MFAEPATTGLNTTSNEQEAPPASEVPKDRAHVLLVMVQVLGPSVARLDRETGPAPTLARDTVCGADEEPTVTDPKLPQVGPGLTTREPTGAGVPAPLEELPAVEALLETPDELPDEEPLDDPEEELPEEPLELAPLDEPEDELGMDT